MNKPYVIGEMAVVRSLMSFLGTIFPTRAGLRYWGQSALTIM
jgi:hypothetical protein